MKKEKYRQDSLKNVDAKTLANWIRDHPPWPSRLHLRKSGLIQHMEFSQCNPKYNKTERKRHMIISYFYYPFTSLWISSHVNFFTIVSWVAINMAGQVTSNWFLTMWCLTSVEPLLVVIQPGASPRYWEMKNKTSSCLC